jgi:hypothetical protein
MPPSVIGSDDDEVSHVSLTPHFFESISDLSVLQTIVSSFTDVDELQHHGELRDQSKL